VEETSRQSLRVPAFVLALGLVSLVLISVNDAIRKRVLVRDAERARNVAEMQTRLAKAHLWVEEYVTGDTIDRAEVQEHLAKCREILAGLLGTVPGTVAVDPIDERQIYELLSRVQPQVETFIGLSGERFAGYDAGRHVGIGSVADIEYDRVFSALADDLRALDELVVEQLDAAHEQSHTLFRFIIVAWAAIVGVSVVGIWTRERRHLAAERALRESEAKLLRSQKMEAIGSLAGGLAHDINNYLAAISAQCEVVRMRAAETDPVAAKMDMVMDTCSRAAALLQRLLAFSRGRPVQPEVVSLNQVVIGLEDMARRLIGENVVLELALGRGLGNVEVEVGQIEQVILNLLVNARDAMPTGGEVRLETRAVAADESPLEGGVEGVALRVSDTGPGIPPEQRDKIFEPFFTTKGKSEHSGLGLATVYGIVRQNRGTIATIDLEDRGATLELVFPRVARKARRSARPAAAAAGRHSGRVLLVEDNERLRTSTEEILSELGFEVTVAADGSEAIAELDEAVEGFDLLLTDVVMPGLNGVDVAREAMARDPGIKVLFASGYADRVMLSHGVDEQGADFLAKPYTGSELSAAIARALDSR